MYSYTDEIYPPKSEQLILVSSKDAPAGYEYDEWVQHVDSQGEIIIQVSCDNEVIMLVRLWE